MQAKRVPCVEDDEDTRDMLRMMLGFSDFETVAAPDIRAGLLAGADAYLVKPDASRLIPTIRRLLEAAA
jgi:CheY-like chemotaxis protein